MKNFDYVLPRTADDYATVAVAATVTLEPDGERVREARKEQLAGRDPRHFRELFRLIREAAANDASGRSI